jgi:AAA15 family ATPase/GTPase
MLSKISIKNFKSISQMDNIALKPITIFTGYNSSGKSNILEAISFRARAHQSIGISRSMQIVF